MSVVFAMLAEGMLVWVWLLVGGGGLSMGLWIWPLVWIVCAVTGLMLLPREARTPTPALSEDAVSASRLLRTLGARTLLVLTPVVVAAYAAVMLVVALSVTGV